MALMKIEGSILCTWDHFLDGRDYIPSSHHLSILEEVVESSPAENLLIRSYGRSFNGFAAKITDSEKQKLEAMEGVVSVFPSRIYHLQTTRSWDFMGFNEAVDSNPSVESDIIVGLLDTGIWPESESFTDEGFGPAPKKWRGACIGGKNFSCNNKIVGARYYPEQGVPMDSARDTNGHGSHTASTAAGNKVKNASFYGLAQGTARGGVPSARIAAYKVCDPECPAEAIMAAFDDAIADGVDILSVSLGEIEEQEFKDDPIAIAAFHAFEKGILTVNSAGNLGSIVRTLSSPAPWMLTVAASSIDRLFIDKVILGNGETFIGNSINSFNLGRVNFPLINGQNASSGSCAPASSQYCPEGCLDSNLVKGKIVLCDDYDGSTEAHRVGAVGSIMRSTIFVNISFVEPLPASGLTDKDYEIVQAYINATKEPVGTILKSETIQDLTAPTIAFFSSRGPSHFVSDILKPDLTAPGVDILAAYSPVAPPSGDPLDKRRVKYNVLSGTSMSCPHVSGAAAYIKTIHPDWSPSAIKSALMTTAWPMNPSQGANEFSYGSGHINPLQAADPGLVYESFKEDQIQFLCNLGYNGTELKQISGDNSTCPEGSKKSSVKDLNYPSMAVKVEKEQPFAVTFHRTVTNVGPANSTYKVNVYPGRMTNIVVVPEVLIFESPNQKRSFNVAVVGAPLADETILSGSFVWFDGTHTVRSPIVIHTLTS
ncbi:subtilisin-like protease SBT4.4 [Carica papaya]|uniref:subtilisin-like protease SBT4.4 n=1 Tax=Carica papaya TaxID=3649 RepID=UPI000B8CC8D6|nr:subtilisin-like protease SBT4.4 [Carica papaya]